MTKNQNTKIDYKAKFENLHAEYKKLQKLLLVNQNFADKMKKENEDLKKELNEIKEFNENLYQDCLKATQEYAEIRNSIFEITNTFQIAKDRITKQNDLLLKLFREPRKCLKYSPFLLPFV